MRLLTQFNGLPEGVKFLVDMRAQLLEWSRTTRCCRRLKPTSSRC